jgi:hypothetical protein
LPIPAQYLLKYNTMFVMSCHLPLASHQQWICCRIGVFVCFEECQRFHELIAL